MRRCTVMNHDTSLEFPKKRLVLYSLLLSAPILMGIILNLSISSAPSASSPITPQDLQEFQMSIQRTQSLNQVSGFVETAF